MRSEYREANKGVGWIIMWVVIGAVILGLGGWAVWGMTVATSGVKGQGDGIIKNNSAENWIAAQEGFEDNYAEYESTIFKITEARRALEADPGNKTHEQTLAGTINYCASIVADYNADSRKFTQQDWKAVDLPSSLDVNSCQDPGLKTLP